MIQHLYNGINLTVDNEETLNESLYIDRYGFDIIDKQYKCFMDVGASYGLITIRNLNRFQEAYLFEPHAKSYKYLFDNVKLFDKPIHTFNVGIGLETRIKQSQLYFDVSDIHPTFGNKALYVEGKFLEIQPNCIKIDTNVCNLDTLRSLYPLLIKYRPDLYIAKYDYHYDISGYLKTLNYRLVLESSNERDRGCLVYMI